MRILVTDGLNPQMAVDKLEQAMEQGVEKSENYLTSVYETLFEAVKGIVYPEDSDGTMPYSYAELLENIPVYAGTTEKEKEEKLKRKFRRAYNVYNNCCKKNEKYKKEIEQWKKADS